MGSKAYIIIIMPHPIPTRRIMPRSTHSMFFTVLFIIKG